MEAEGTESASGLHTNPLSPVPLLCCSFSHRSSFKGSTECLDPGPGGPRADSSCPAHPKYDLTRVSRRKGKRVGLPKPGLTSTMEVILVVVERKEGITS